ncbi:MAG: hypothetical protein EAY66_08180 [Sphingobacteriales bacterium]|nr:MAG: hypothetical protein EAY66_08180 [Sphingobacteriales bacterium]
MFGLLGQRAAGCRASGCELLVWFVRAAGGWLLGLCPKPQARGSLLDSPLPDSSLPDSPKLVAY